jgi:hypothetical protein
MRVAALCLALLTCGCASTAASIAKGPSPYLLILAADEDGREEDFFAVADLRPGSATLGQVIATHPIGHRNSMPHHMEYELPTGSDLVFANAHHAEATMLVDVSRAPAISIRRSLQPPPPFRFPHDYARLPNGNVLMGFLRSEGGSPKAGDSLVPGGHGGLAEYTPEGDLLRAASAAAPDVADPIRTYAILPLPQVDRIVTTSARMMEEHSADVVQIWRYSDFKLLKTLQVPGGRKADGSPLDWAGMLPFGPRLMGDGSVLMNSYMCGFYRLTDIASDEPRLSHVYDIQGRDLTTTNTRVGCSVPVVIGNHWIMPVAWSQMVVILDIADPSAPREIARLMMPSDFNAHWAAKDPGSNRIVVGAETEKEKGVFVLLHDPATGQLAFDSSVGGGASPPGYIDLAKQRWSHGESGSARAHSALFLPSSPN